MMTRSDVVHLLVRFGAEEYGGTGFYLQLRTQDRDRYVLVTAFHVVAHAQGEQIVWADQVTVELGSADGHDFFVTEEDLELDSRLGFDPWEDWVAFLVERPTVPAWRPARVRGRQSWTTYGFPLGTGDDGVACRGDVVTISSSLNWSACLVERKVRCLQLRSDEASASAPLPVAGFSGAPVMVQGKVTGVVRSFRSAGGSDGDLAQFNAQGGIIMACPVEYVVEELSRALGVLIEINDVEDDHQKADGDNLRPTETRTEANAIGTGVVQNLTERAKPVAVAILAWEGLKSLVKSWSGLAAMGRWVVVNVVTVSWLSGVVAGTVIVVSAIAVALSNEKAEDHLEGARGNRPALSEEAAIDAGENISSTEDTGTVGYEDNSFDDQTEITIEPEFPQRNSAKLKPSSSTPEQTSVAMDPKEPGTGSKTKQTPDSPSPSQTYKGAKLDPSGPEVPFDYLAERAIKLELPSIVDLRNSHSARKKISGVVSVFFCVEKNGSVKYAFIRKRYPTDDADIHRILVNAVKSWQFEPMPIRKCAERSFKLTFE
jgi:hypothetical protein